MIASLRCPCSQYNLLYEGDSSCQLREIRVSRVCEEREFSVIAHKRAKICELLEHMSTQSGELLFHFHVDFSVIAE